ncbi:hypothetical protein XNC1_1036 [Xenorhabdus nematophila ATCC 19061]|uniref:Uncharacterized protein n=1 Tax=Xenorhabdus nematophila (strain ATCC 19061 / DSM 3370 / CCUG 14189 / LMG 1036 / NCIMB 9965 / AN6) TaxID=406817 RepID=D3V8Q9_XENNA|nr:hypothetical protein XNC1_1036 [Xenorhabdus nematophila ATCC 19061]
MPLHTCHHLVHLKLKGVDTLNVRLWKPDPLRIITKKTSSWETVWSAYLGKRASIMRGNRLHDKKRRQDQGD